MSRITGWHTADVRFATSLSLDGSDAMNPDPDYSAAYLEVGTDADDGLSGHGFVFTIGRGNDVQVAAIRALADRLEGRDVEELLADMGAVWRELVHDSQLRWLGPEEGVMHMAVGAVINALWDLKAKREGKPLWDVLSAMTPEQLVELVDFRYLTDALTPQDALAILRAAEPTRAQRRTELLASGYPAYTTTPGWLGYDDEKLARLCREAVADRFTQIKLKVGADLEDDLRRLAIARREVGRDVKIAVDAHQRWDVAEAISWITALAPYDLAWVEEPTSPDDVLGHAASARDRAGAGRHRRAHVEPGHVQAVPAGPRTAGAADRRHPGGGRQRERRDPAPCRKFGVPVCPHAGGVGLCEAVQHLAMFDFVAVSGSLHGRVIEFVDHLHEHFVSPVDVRGGRYLAPTSPGAGTQMRPGSIIEHSVAPRG